MYAYIIRDVLYARRITTTENDRPSVRIFLLAGDENSPPARGAEARSRRRHACDTRSPAVTDDPARRFGNATSGKRRKNKSRP